MEKRKNINKLDDEIDAQIKKLSDFHLNSTIKDLIEIMKKEFVKNNNSEILEVYSFQHDKLCEEKEIRDNKR